MNIKLFTPLSIKTLLLIVGMLLTFTNCQKDDNLERESVVTPVEEKGSGNQFRHLTMEDLNQIEILNRPLKNINNLMELNNSKTARLGTNNGSMVILTDDIVELTTPNSVSYSFRTEAPLNPDAEFENLVLFKKDGEPFKYYLYSYVSIKKSDEETKYYPIGRIELDGDNLGLDALVDNLTSRIMYSNGCMWEVYQHSNGDITITQLFCAALQSGGVFVGVGGWPDGVQPEGEIDCKWQNVGSPNGDGKCVWEHRCTSNQGMFYIKEWTYGACNQGDTGDTGHNPDTGDNGGDGGDGGLDSGPIGGGEGTGGGGTPGDGEGDGETVGLNPPRDVEQEIMDCFSGAGLLVNTSNLTFNQQRDLANYLRKDTNDNPFDFSGTNCSDPEALIFAYSAYKAMSENPDLSFEEEIIEGFNKVLEEIPTARLDRYMELMDLVEDNPWALLQDCLQQNGLDIANYQYLYNHTIPQECQDRLNVLGDDFQNQPLDEGNAAVANVDYYGVEITARPDINNDGNPDTDAEIFQAYKENFTILASGSKEDFQFNCDIPFNSNNQANVGWDFIPYYANDIYLWNSTNPLTAIFKIDAWAEVPFGIADDGAIMISEYTSNYWIGSTIQTTFSDTQPFSGNRQWGLLTNQSGNLELYARAVDVARVDDWIRRSPLTGEECEDLDYYNIGDATWSNLQQEIKQFIIDNGGQAQVIEPNYARFDKEKIEEILESNDSIDQILCD